MIHGDDIYVLTNLSGTQAPIAAAKTGDLDISQDFIKASFIKLGSASKVIKT